RRSDRVDPPGWLWCASPNPSIGGFADSARERRTVPEERQGRSFGEVPLDRRSARGCARIRSRRTTFPCVPLPPAPLFLRCGLMNTTNGTVRRHRVLAAVLHAKGFAGIAVIGPVDARGSGVRRNGVGVFFRLAARLHVQTPRETGKSWVGSGVIVREELFWSQGKVLPDFHSDDFHGKTLRCLCESGPFKRPVRLC